MSEENRSKPDERLIAGRSVEDWDQTWKLIPEGFKVLQSNLRRDIGLFAAKRGQQIMYIGSAVQTNNGGLRAGLARARLKSQTGNSSYGMRKVRSEIDTVEAFVICVQDFEKNGEDTKKLKAALLALHNPPWNAPREVVAAQRQASYDKGKS